MISCTWMKHGLTKITAQIICSFQMMGLMPQKYPWVKGNKRLIVWHAGTRSECLIDGCDLVFLATSRDGDYHQEMNSVVFLEWLENQLMPALKNHSLVVLDNASYHNVKTENFSQRKAVLQNYLTQYNIPFSATDTKTVLYEKIKQKKTPEVYKTDKIANLHGYEVLRTFVRQKQKNMWSKLKKNTAKKTL